MRLNYRLVTGSRLWLFFFAVTIPSWPALKLSCFAGHIFYIRLFGYRTAVFCAFDLFDGDFKQFIFKIVVYLTSKLLKKLFTTSRNSYITLTALTRYLVRGAYLEVGGKVIDFWTFQYYLYHFHLYSTVVNAIES